MNLTAQDSQNSLIEPFVPNVNYDNENDVKFLR